MIPAERVEGTVAGRFATHVALAPDRVAVKQADGAYSFARLNAAANGVARAVRGAVGRDQGPVPLLLRHGSPMVVGLLGVIKVGGICAPLDVGHPPARLAALVDACGPQVLVSDESMLGLAHEVAGGRCRVITLEETEALATNQDCDVTVDPGAPAYLLFTSGTTGVPKGVLHSHRNLLHRVEVQAETLAVGPADRFTWFSSASAGQGSTNLLTALLTGGTLLPYAPREQGIAALPDLLRDERVTILSASATLFRTLVDGLRPTDRFPDMRVVRLGGERVRIDDVRALERHFSRECLFVNQYSCTEASGICQYRIPDSAQMVDDLVPVGHPLPDQHVVLLDEVGAAVPPGAVGEIAVRSRYLALGYWRDPERSAAVFRQVPGSSDERLYSTGDLGRFRADGCLEYLGRKDGRVKVRGFRVELEEIDDVLARHPAVLRGATRLVKTADADDQLAAYFVAAPAEAPTASQLHVHMLQHLPAGIVPSWFIEVDRLPLTLSGKVDRSALPDPVTRRERREETLAPATATERAVGDYWHELLGSAALDVRDEFLTVGGDSLRATRLLVRVQNRWGVEVSMAEFLAAPTIGGLAALIDVRLEERNRAERALLASWLDDLDRPSTT